MFDSQPKIFRIVILVVFGFLIVGGTAAVALFRSDDKAFQGEIVVWGTLKSSDFDRFARSLARERKVLENVTYIEKDPRTYYSELVNALAAWRGPDLFLIDQNELVNHEDKIRKVSYETLPERTYRTEYIEGAEIFLRTDGIMAVPFSVDPMVMYWNRDLFFANGLANPPQFWDELVGLTDRLTVLDQNQNITQSAVAFGGYDNVTNAKEILSTLLLQLRIPMVSWNPRGGVLVSLTRPTGAGGTQAQSEDFANGTAALRFYTEFADPVRSVYSWNRAMPESRQAFLAGDLALYFGYASEYESLRAGNPNLNIDLAPVPGPRGVARRITHSTITGFAIPISSSNAGNAYAAARSMSDAIALRAWAETTGLPPVHRALLNNPPTDSFGAVVYDAALNAHTWLDPNQAGSDTVFKTMIDDIASGRLDVNQAVRTAEGALQRLVPQR